MKQPWTETKEALFTTYQTDAHGLSGGEAQKRLAQYGENCAFWRSSLRIYWC